MTLKQHCGGIYLQDKKNWGGGTHLKKNYMVCGVLVV